VDKTSEKLKQNTPYFRSICYKILYPSRRNTDVVVTVVVPVVVDVETVLIEVTDVGVVTVRRNMSVPVRTTRV